MRERYATIQRNELTQMHHHRLKLITLDISRNKHIGLTLNSQVEITAAQNILMCNSYYGSYFINIFYLLLSHILDLYR